MFKLRIFALLVLASLVLVIPASAATSETMTGQFLAMAFKLGDSGYNGKNAGEAQYNGLNVKEMLFYEGCGISAEAVIEGDTISITYTPSERCAGLGMFAFNKPITLSGHYTPSSRNVVVFFDHNVFEDDAGNPSDFTTMFEEASGCTIQRGFDPRLGGRWIPGQSSNIRLFFGADCSDAVFPTNSPTVIWSWGFSVSAPVE